MHGIEHHLDNQITKGKTPSLQYSFFSNDSHIFSYRKGLADISSHRMVDDQTTTHLFSITKTFTALAILQLEDRGLLNIEDSVQKYYPDFRYDFITIKHLLNHSSGLPNPLPIRWIHLVGEHDTFNYNLFFENVIGHDIKLRFEPNDRFSYSNLGYVILGKIIETISNMPYEEFIGKNIFNKINLLESDIGFTIPGNDKHAVGYHARWSVSNLILGLLLNRSKFMEEGKGNWIPFKSFYVNGVAYGGALGTLNAMVRYGQELLTPTSNLISDRVRTLLFRENFTNNGKPTGMCSSWFKGSLKGHTYFTHAGGGGGYYSEIRLYPDLNKGSVLLLNRSGFSDERFLNQVDKYFVS